MQILLANPRGFCAGVDRAIAIVEKALELFGKVYVRHEVVHNRYVVEKLKQKGAVFVEELHEIPEDKVTVIFSAHGVSQAVKEEAKQRNFNVFDATCPLVTKVHTEVARHARDIREVVLIGHANHPEVEGTLGQYLNPNGTIYLVENEQDVKNLTVESPNNIAYVTQTTLSVDDTHKIIDALKIKFPNIIGPKREDICYATQNRQDAIKLLAKQSNVVLVVGSKNSSNSNRLRELAETIGARSYLLDDASLIDPKWFSKNDVVGITAGASAPEVLVKGVIEKLQQMGASPPQNLQGVTEDVVFSLPKILRENA